MEDADKFMRDALEQVKPTSPEHEAKLKKLREFLDKSSQELAASIGTVRKEISQTLASVQEQKTSDAEAIKAREEMEHQFYQGLADTFDAQAKTINTIAENWKNSFSD